MQLAVSGMCHFHSNFMVIFLSCSAFSFMVIFLFCSPFSFMVIFLFCSPFSFMAFVFYTFFHGVFHLQVGTFLALYPFHASFMVFSSPNLAFVACVAFSLVFLHLLLLYKFYSVFIPPFFGQLNSGPILKDWN